MNDRLQRLIDMRDSLDQDKPGIGEQNKDIKGVAHALLRESVELLEKVLVGASADEIADEAADVFWFLVVIFKGIQRDLYEAASEKHAYNLFRWVGFFGEPNEYSRDYPMVKQRERSLGLREVWQKILPVRPQET